MEIEKVEFLENRVRIYYRLTMPYFEPDKKGDIDILYNDINKLPLLPDNIEKTGFVSRSFKEVYIPKINKKIALVYSSERTRDSGPEEESFKGVYKK